MPIGETTFRESGYAFAEAIQHGYLTTIDHGDGKYVGDWMYMHTDINGSDHFKHIITRKYMVVEYTDI